MVEALLDLESASQAILSVDSRGKIVPANHPAEEMVTDVVMPEMSGRQVAGDILAARREVKVLFLSGYTQHTAIHQGIGSGVNFLAKPFNRETLARKLLEIANNARGAGA